MTEQEQEKQDQLDDVTGWLNDSIGELEAAVEAISDGQLSTGKEMVERTKGDLRAVIDGLQDAMEESS